MGAAAACVLDATSCPSPPPNLPFRFSGSAALMHVRTRLGGEAHLQWAICLDSLGRNAEAFEIYAKVERHPAPGVAKKAKRMLFGFRAAEVLKVNRAGDYSTTDQWQRHFERINRGSVYNAPGVTPPESEEDVWQARTAVAASLAMIAVPLALVAVKVAMH